MKTVLYAQIYNPYSADMIFRLRKDNVNLENFLNSDVFASALKTSAEIYTNSLN